MRVSSILALTPLCASALSLSGLIRSSGDPSTHNAVAAPNTEGTIVTKGILDTRTDPNVPGRPGIFSLAKGINIFWNRDYASPGSNNRMRGAVSIFGPFLMDSTIVDIFNEQADKTTAITLSIAQHLKETLAETVANLKELGGSVVTYGNLAPSPTDQIYWMQTSIANIPFNAYGIFRDRPPVDQAKLIAAITAYFQVAGLPVTVTEVDNIALLATPPTSKLRVRRGEDASLGDERSREDNASHVYRRQDSVLDAQVCNSPVDLRQNLVGSLVPSIDGNASIPGC